MLTMPAFLLESLGGNPMQGLSVVICTRNRVADLSRCIRSLAVQTLPEPYAIEVIVIDDGDVPGVVLLEYEQLLASCGFAFVYEKKRHPGLWLSRVRAVSLASMDTILFLDDDVELPVHYVAALFHTYADYPDAAGVGGVALGMSNSFGGTIRCLFSFQQSPFKGKLSLSGQSGSMYNWHKARKPFRTEFFHGCNMSFKKAAIRHISPVSWLSSYSVGEDILLSHIARRSGPLIVNPDLSLVHHESPASRDRMEDIAYMRVVNHVHLLKEMKAGPVRYWALLWTTLYLILREKPKNNVLAITGYKRGLRAILSKKIPQHG